MHGMWLWTVKRTNGWSEFWRCWQIQQSFSHRNRLYSGTIIETRERTPCGCDLFCETLKGHVQSPQMAGFTLSCGCLPLNELGPWWKSAGVQSSSEAAVFFFSLSPFLKSLCHQMTNRNRSSPGGGGVAEGKGINSPHFKEPSDQDWLRAQANVLFMDLISFVTFLCSQSFHLYCL